MKKITSSATLGGAPFTKEDMRTVFNDELWDAIEAMLFPFNADTEGIIVSGCVVSGGGPYDISAGIVYLDGEFMRLPAATGQTLPKYIAAAAAVNDARTFADGTNNTLFITKAAELVGSAPGTQYVAITTATDPDDRRIAKVYDGPWTNIGSFANSWAAGTPTPQYRVDKSGRVYFRGRLNGTLSTNAIITAVAAVPVPSNGAGHFFPIYSASSGAIGVIEVESTGRLQIIFGYTTDSFELEPVSYNS